MAVCPNCRTEYVAGTTRCGDCGAELTDALPQVPSAGVNAEALRPVELCELGDQVQLDLIETQLRAAGIPCIRRPRKVALFVPAFRLEQAQRVMSGQPTMAAPVTLGLSELHRIRLECSECGKVTSVDLVEEHVPPSCSCGHHFDLSAARLVLDRYTDLMRTMAEADFEIEVEAPHSED